MCKLTVLVPHKSKPVSDLDSGHEEPKRGCLGWALVLSFCLIPGVLVVHDLVASSKAEAQFQRDMRAEQKEMRRLMTELSKGNEEQKRIAREIAAFQKAGGR